MSYILGNSSHRETTAINKTASMGSIVSRRSLSDFTDAELQELVKCAIVSNPFRSAPNVTLSDDEVYAQTVAYMATVGVRPITAREYRREILAMEQQQQHLMQMKHSPQKESRRKISIWQPITEADFESELFTTVTTTAMAKAAAEAAAAASKREQEQLQLQQEREQERHQLQLQLFYQQQLLLQQQQQQQQKVKQQGTSQQISQQSYQRDQECKQQQHVQPDEAELPTESYLISTCTNTTDLAASNSNSNSNSNNFGKGNEPNDAYIYSLPSCMPSKKLCIEMISRQSNEDDSYNDSKCVWMINSVDIGAITAAERGGEGAEEAMITAMSDESTQEWAAAAASASASVGPMGRK